MNRESLDDLIQTVLDGDATGQQRVQLAHLLETDANARTRHAELEVAFEALAGVKPAEAPADLRDNILAEIRSAAAARNARPQRAASLPTRRPAFSWFRLALPIAACAAAAVVLVWNAKKPLVLSSDSGTSGTMAASGPSGSLSLGPAGRAVKLHWRAAGSDFQLQAHGGNEPAQIMIEPVGDGVRMGSAAGAAGAAGSTRIESRLEADAVIAFSGTALHSHAALRVTVTYADGQTAITEIGLEPGSAGR